MTDKHNYSFFGQKVGLIVQSSSKNAPFIFFRLLKVKENGTWEKPSNSEGKVIKFSIEEMVWIIRVLKKEVKSWSSFHSYKDRKTQITFKWEENENGKLWIHIGGYSKILDYSQFKILEMLMEHILQEKIEFSTSTNMKTRVVKNESGKSQVTTDNLSITEERINVDSDEIKDNLNNKTYVVKGKIKGETEKAYLIALDSDSNSNEDSVPNAEYWFPKSTIKSPVADADSGKQAFEIETWILKKNKIKI